MMYLFGLNTSEFFFSLREMQFCSAATAAAADVVGFLVSLFVTAFFLLFFGLLFVHTYPV